jgi:hypothetical protein
MIKTFKMLVLIISSTILTCCGGGSTKKPENQSNSDISVDICKCLTEPGDSQWAIENKDACNNAISKEIGVENWEKVNFSKEPELNRKWDLLVKRCTGNNEVKTGIEEIDSKSELVKEIGTSYGYIWESIDIETQLYTTLAFDGLVFRITVYSMDGKTNSEDFNTMMDLSGKWNVLDKQNVEGIYENNVSVIWSFDDSYSTLTNDKGGVFNRVKVK